MVGKWFVMVGKTGGFRCNFIEKWLVFYTFPSIKTKTLKTKPNLKYVF